MAFRKPSHTGALTVSLGGVLAALLVACSTQQVPPKRAESKPASVPAEPKELPGVREGVDPEVARRAEELLAQMTLEEKIDYLGGDRGFYIRPIERLGIPEIKMSDGPAGCRNWGPSTAYPAAVAVTAAFDRGLSERVGHAMGRDCRARGVHVLLAPGVNIQRSPLNGRNFEYMGEDPYLAGQAAASFIRGLQAEGVLGTVKHFVANNQEWDRNHVSSEVDERTLREIYFPAFETAVVDAKVGSVMTSYNLLNGTYASHDAWLLKTVLKEEWAFNGFVMSDWAAVHDTLSAATSGLDLEMPSGAFMNRQKLLPLLEVPEGAFTNPRAVPTKPERKPSVAEIDDKVRRILRTLIAAGFFDRPQKRDDIPLHDSSSVAVALEAARQGMVLLKNEGSLLPLDRKKVRTIAVVGPNADPAVVGGSGSGYVTPLAATSVLDGIKALAPDAKVLHHPGVRERTNVGLLGAAVFSGPVTQEFFLGRDLEGKAVATREVDRIDFHPGDKPPTRDVPAENYSVRWSGDIEVTKSAQHTVITNADDGIRVFVDGKLVLDDWSDHAPRTKQTTIELTPGTHRISVEYYQGILGAIAQVGIGPAVPEHTFEGAKELTALVRQADVVVVCVGFGQSADTNSYGRGFEPFWPPGWVRNAGLVEAEDSDRPFSLPAAQLETLRAVASANRRSIVVANAGGGVAFDGWLERVPALLWAWYPGQEGGTAVAELLFGDQNPSGKLPVTFAARYEDHPSAPYYQLNENQRTPYKEGVFVGYRGFDARGVAPAFPFGHGLSYTSFEYGALAVEPGANGEAKVRFSVKNTGKRAGDEVAQVYVAPPKGRVPRPPQELKGFARVHLEPGEEKAIEVSLDARAFAHWSAPPETTTGWAIAPGSYEIRVGASSRDVRLKAPLEVAARTLAVSHL